MPRLRSPLMVYNEPIPENKCHSFLGITLDSRLTYNQGCNFLKMVVGAGL